MGTFDWQRALKAGIGVFALGVILAMVLLVGRPAMQTTGPMMGHGAMTREVTRQTTHEANRRR